MQTDVARHFQSTSLQATRRIFGPRSVVFLSLEILEARLRVCKAAFSTYIASIEMEDLGYGVRLWTDPPSTDAYPQSTLLEAPKYETL